MESKCARSNLSQCVLNNTRTRLTLDFLFLIPKNSKTRPIVISGKCVSVMILVTINFSEWLLYMHNGYKNVHRPDTRSKNAPGLRSNNTSSIYTSDKF